MHKHLFSLLAVLLLFQGCNAGESTGDKTDQNVRLPAVAGKFYPGEADQLRAAIAGFLEDAITPASLKDAQPVALIAPHAGYIYSGQIAADAYAAVSGNKYDLVVILGTNHTTPGFDDFSIYPRGAYRTPLGDAAIDAEFADRLMKEADKCSFNPAVHRQEHSVEVQVPFVQYILPGVKILPVVVGTNSVERCTAFGKSIAAVAGNRKILIVTSSDLSHYPDYDDAVDVDNKLLTAVGTLDPANIKSAIEKNIRRRLPNLSTCACGEGAIMVAMSAAKALGAKQATIVSYANSGDALVGDRSRVVGYGAVVFTRDVQTGLPPLNPPLQSRGGGALSNEVNSGSLTGADKTALLRLARKTMQRYLTSQTVPLPRGFSSAANNKQGAFVTLNKHGELRGCIGHMAEDTPLYQVVGEMALAAAFNDRRFSPVEVEELDDIEIEISVLTPYEKINKPDDFIVGRDGIVIRKSGRSAVYLPQVAPEQGWNREETLDHLCLKAGLPRGSWREGAELFTFQADVFHEGGKE